jgi:hypothetical protein
LRGAFVGQVPYCPLLTLVPSFHHCLVVSFPLFRPFGLPCPPLPPPSLSFVLAGDVAVSTHNPPCEQWLTRLGPGAGLSFVAWCSFVPPSPALPCRSCWLVMWPLAPAIHPASSGLQAWGWVLCCHSASPSLPLPCPALPCPACWVVICCVAFETWAIGAGAGPSSPLCLLTSCHRSTHDPPHKQLLVRLGQVVCRSLHCPPSVVLPVVVVVVVVPPTFHPTSSCS